MMEQRCQSAEMCNFWPLLFKICTTFNIVLFFATKIPINCSFHKISCLFPGVISAPIGTFGAT